MSSDPINRRDFVRATAGVGLAAATPIALGATTSPIGAPAVRPSAVRPLVIADASGIEFKNGGPECAVERAFRLITEGKDVLVYIHGFNETFGSAATSYAKLISGIGFTGAPILFTWPSRGALLD